MSGGGVCEIGGLMIGPDLTAGSPSPAKSAMPFPLGSTLTWVLCSTRCMTCLSIERLKSVFSERGDDSSLMGVEAGEGNDLSDLTQSFAFGEETSSESAKLSPTKLLSLSRNSGLPT